MSTDRGLWGVQKNLRKFCSYITTVYVEAATDEAPCPPAHRAQARSIPAWSRLSHSQLCPEDLAFLSSGAGCSLGRHLSQAHMPLEVKSDPPGLSERNSILTPPHPPLPSSLASSHSPPQKPHYLQSPLHQEIYQKKDHLGWKQFTMATARFPGVYRVCQAKSCQRPTLSLGFLKYPTS